MSLFLTTMDQLTPTIEWTHQQPHQQHQLQRQSTEEFEEVLMAEVFSFTENISQDNDLLFDENTSLSCLKRQKTEDFSFMDSYVEEDMVSVHIGPDAQMVGEALIEEAQRAGFYNPEPLALNSEDECPSPLRNISTHTLSLNSSASDLPSTPVDRSSKFSFLTTTSTTKLRTSTTSSSSDDSFVPSPHLDEYDHDDVEDDLPESVKIDRKLRKKVEDIVGKKRAKDADFQEKFSQWQNHVCKMDHALIKEFVSIVSNNDTYNKRARQWRTRAKQGLASEFLTAELKQARKRYRDRTAKRIKRAAEKNGTESDMETDEE